MENKTLTAANTARQAAALDKVYRFSDVTETFRQRIERGVYAVAEAAAVPKVSYSRRKWNRMNARQQAEYERAMKETKTEYRLFYAADSDAFSVVPKMVFDWFTARNA